MSENLHKVYMNRKQIQEYLGCGRSFVDSLKKGIRNEIETGRYGPFAICGDWVHVGVMMDYIKYRSFLEQKNVRDLVPKFNINEALQYAVGSTSLYEIQ